MANPPYLEKYGSIRKSSAMRIRDDKYLHPRPIGNLAKLIRTPTFCSQLYPGQGIEKLPVTVSSHNMQWALQNLVQTNKTISIFQDFAKESQS